MRLLVGSEQPLEPRLITPARLLMIEHMARGGVFRRPAPKTKGVSAARVAVLSVRCLRSGARLKAFHKRDLA